MSRKTLIEMAASAAVLAYGLTACAPLSGSGETASAGSQPARGARHAVVAEKALGKHEVAKAVHHAEEAVAFAPADPSYRGLLGQAYLAAGRFLSAERSFVDVMDLGAPDARSVIGLSLARTALGKTDMARETLESNRDMLPAGDYGLALALSGDTERAIEVLSAAIRQSDSSARVRQNLALAYALAGRWRDAQLMAARDATPEQVVERLSDWAKIARPGAHEARVASLLGVTPDLADPGQPVRLALRPADEIQALAEAEPAVPALPAEVADADAPLAATGPGVAIADGGMIAPAAVESDVQMMPQMARMPAPPADAGWDAPQPVPDSTVRLAALAGPPAPLKAMATQPVVRSFAVERAEKQGNMLVQIGAFSSDANARQAWKLLNKRHGELGALASATTKAVVGGKTFYRLAAVGLTSKEAKSLCNSLRRSGRDCFVRADVTKPSNVRVAAR